MVKQKIQYFLGLVSPKLITYILYYKTFHKILNLRKPKTINEKIHWMKFYGDTSEWPMLADKYRVRQFVKSKGLEQTLVKLYGHWERFDDIDWDGLPDKFVLKVNNGCGDILICRDKSGLNKKDIREIYSRLLNMKFGVETGQTHYLNIHPCLIVEELLDASKQQVESSSLIDYKIWCFNGTPEYIFVYINRNKDKAECMVYDKEWHSHPEYLVSSTSFSIIHYPVPKPKCLSEMLDIAKILSEGHPQMRVDLYEVDNKVYFGELTMTAACGLMNHFTNDFLELMGSKIVLPEEKR